MNTQHTPGPWHYCDDLPDSVIGYRAIIDADGFTVCNPSPMGAANARLIAAAPDLLAALQIIRAAAHYAKDNPCRQPYKIFDILDTARAAIAKATGESV